MWTQTYLVRSFFVGDHVGLCRHLLACVEELKQVFQSRFKQAEVYLKVEQKHFKVFLCQSNIFIKNSIKIKAINGEVR